MPSNYIQSPTEYALAVDEWAAGFRDLFARRPDLRAAPYEQLIRMKLAEIRGLQKVSKAQKRLAWWVAASKR